MSDLRKTFGANLRAERNRRGLRQVDLGAALHLGPTTISDLETGQREVTLGELVQICRVLDVGLRDLLRRADDAAEALFP